MKNIFLLLLFAFLSVNYVNAQGIPPPPGCECCAGLEGTLLSDCITACQESELSDYCNDAVPINSNIFILFASAISLGGYFYYKSHKKNLH